MDLVSIIVPVYDTEEYLPNCVESILRQTYSNIEVILVDDESPDNCPQICEDYVEKDSRVQVIHQNNKGVSGARNTGLSAAKGNYIMFVDSDDQLFDNSVEVLLGDAKKHNADIVSGDKITIDQYGHVSNGSDNHEKTIYSGHEPLILSLDGERHTSSACAKLYRKDFINDLFFEEGKNTNEDGFFVFQCYMRQPILVQHNIPVYKYIYRENSCTKQKFSDKLCSMLYFCEKKMHMVEETYPQYIGKAHNMEVRTNLLFLDRLCGTTEKKYKPVEKKCLKTVRDNRKFFKPVNSHQKLLAWIVTCRLYSLYKFAVRIKYYTGK